MNAENLETKCAHCDGRGKRTDASLDDDYDCEKCNGSGFVPTRFGMRVLELVRHNTRVRSEIFVGASS